MLCFYLRMEGAREGGVGGFAKGLGKGVIGVVARPASGLVDFASGTMDAVKRYRVLPVERGNKFVF